ncbi:cation diffusion facilitator family transporter, partial [Acidobacteria bacterium AH-259-G07]|nr:cation diffusion facilitator family transporter [Acidobacteria bacterium AH-259-G07]
MERHYHQHTGASKKESLEESRENLGAQEVSRRKGTRALRVALVITVTFMLAEFLGGLWTNSLALLADAGHMLTDAAALGLSLFAVWFIRRPATSEKTYGYFRVEILAALINGATLLVIAFFILLEAYERFLQPEEIKSFEMLVIAVLGLGANLFSAWILYSSQEESLNIRGAFLHVMGDVLGSVGAIGASLAIIFWQAYWADPAVSALVSFLILFSAWRLVKDSVLVLLEGTPAHVNLAAMKSELRKVPGVESVHDLHVWTLTSGVHAMTCHAVVDGEDKRYRILEQLIAVCREQFNIRHTTI